MKPSIAILQISADIKLKFNYTCASCGEVEIGDQVTRSFLKLSSVSELKKVIDSIPQLSHYMPVGWSYNGDYKCKVCTEVSRGFK